MGVAAHQPRRAVELGRPRDARTPRTPRSCGTSLSPGWVGVTRQTHGSGGTSHRLGTDPRRTGAFDPRSRARRPRREAGAMAKRLFLLHLGPDAGRRSRDARRPRTSAGSPCPTPTPRSSTTRASRSAARTRPPASSASRSRAPGRRCAARPTRPRPTASSACRLLRRDVRAGRAGARRPRRLQGRPRRHQRLRRPAAGGLAVAGQGRTASTCCPTTSSDEQLAAQVARIALIEEEARLDKRLAKISRAPQAGQQAAGRLIAGRLPAAISAAARRPRPAVRAATPSGSVAVGEVLDA